MRFSFSPARRTLVGTVAVAATAAVAVVYVKVQGGIAGFPSMLFVGHDLLIAAVLALLAWLATGRRWTSVVAGTGAVALFTFASTLKADWTLLPIVAGDLPRILDLPAMVVEFGRPAVVLSLAGLAVLVPLAWLERPVPRARQQWLPSLGAIAVLIALAAAIQAMIPVHEHAVITTRGPKVALFLRSIHAGADFADASFPSLAPYCCFRNDAAATLRFDGPVMPHIVVVLQESTFPPENLKDVAPVRNRLLDGASPLSVDVVGGGTWVEEYALLHGVPPSVYGRDFVQILWLGRQVRLEGRLVPMLRHAGYRSVSIVPVLKHVLADTEQMHRSLGIERVVDCSETRGCSPTGSWSAVPDAVVYDRALDELRAAAQPLFVYAATIRQHSPHVRKYPLTSHRGEVLAEYLRRLELSAAELEDFLAALRTLDRPTLVLAFGDHLPADVNAAFSPDGFERSRRQTFFNVFDYAGKGIASGILAAHSGVDAPSTAFLDAILLRQAGFTGDYVDRKLRFMRDCGGTFCQPASTPGAAPQRRLPAGRRRRRRYGEGSGSDSRLAHWLSRCARSKAKDPNRQPTQRRELGRTGLLRLRHHALAFA